MTTLQLLIICGTAIALALIALSAKTEGRVAAGDTPSWDDVVPPAPGATVAIRTRSGATIRGLVDHAGSSSTVLREGAVVAVGNQEQPLGGRVRVPTASIDWTQEI